MFWVTVNIKNVVFTVMTPIKVASNHYFGHSIHPLGQITIGQNWWLLTNRWCSSDCTKQITELKNSCSQEEPWLLVHLYLKGILSFVALHLIIEDKHGSVSPTGRSALSIRPLVIWVVILLVNMLVAIKMMMMITTKTNVMQFSNPV